MKQKFSISSQLHRRAHHLQHAVNAIVPCPAAFDERRALNRLPVIARGARFGLRHVRERRIVLPVVAAHFVNHQVQRRHDEEREAAENRLNLLQKQTKYEAW